MGKVIEMRRPVKDQSQLQLELQFAKRTVEIYDTYLSMAAPGARKSVGREIGALRQEMFGGGRGPEPGAALRAPLRRAA